MKTLFFGIVFGIDMIIAMVIFLTLSLAFSKGWDISNLWLAIMFAHLPDIDMVVYLLIKQKLRLPSHWQVGHHPLIVIPCTLITVRLLTPDTYYIAMAGLGLVGHFIHDAMSPTGFHFLSPFSWKRFRVKNYRLVHIPLKTWYKRFQKRSVTWNGDIIKQMVGRAEPITVRQLFIWAMVYICILIFKQTN